MTSTPATLAKVMLVYDISVLSTISSALAEILPSSASSLSRLNALFTIGVHDIPHLTTLKDSEQNSWIACTTDEILSMKTDLYDYIVELPLPGAIPQGWPRIKASTGGEFKATQRDLRRWRALKRALYISSKQPRYTDEASDEGAIADDEGAGLLHSVDDWDDYHDDSSNPYDPIVEPTSWSSLAYSGFMWWASAGERDAAMDAEEQQDAQLNGDLEDAPPPPSSPRGYRDENGVENGEEQEQRPAEVDSTLCMELVAYFHRYSHQILSVATNIVDAESEDGTEADEGDEEIVINEEDLRRMGLDSWSAADARFAREVVEMYLGRRASVRGSGIECCGVRISI
jgi:hypothetical protein